MKMTSNSIPGFYEVQRFKNPWLRYSVAGLTIGFILFFIPGAVKQLVYGQPWGNKPVSDATLVAVGIVVLGTMFALCFFFFNLKLITLVNSQGVWIRLFPLTKEMIPFREIVHCEPTTYNAMEEFGGWGIKYSKRGKALTIYGDKAVQLTLKNGQVLLIGSQRPKELSKCISSFLSDSGRH